MEDFCGASRKGSVLRCFFFYILQAPQQPQCARFFGFKKNLSQQAAAASVYVISFVKSRDERVVILLAGCDLAVHCCVGGA